MCYRDIDIEIEIEIQIQKMEYYSAFKKKEILSFVTTWMNLEGTMLSNPDRERQILHGITYMWNIEKKKLNS